MTNIYIQVPIYRNRWEPVQVAEALIDLDAARLILDGRKWFMHDQGYAQRGFRNSGRKIVQYMHRLILDPACALQVDHVNGNRLDNRKANLRLVTASQNRRNRGKTRVNTSGYKGVIWDKKSRKWGARIGIHGKLINLGYFDTPEAAAKAYDEASLNIHKEYGKLNFGNK